MIMMKQALNLIDFKGVNEKDGYATRKNSLNYNELR
jgi:hypothetical protein